MLLSLGMGQVGSFIVVQSQAEFTFVRSQMIFHKVRILGQIDRFQRQLTQAFSPIPVGIGSTGHATAAGFATRSMLKIHS